MKNERGSSLILVMLISLLFVTLGLMILSVSIEGTKRTTVRENDVVTSQEAILEMSKILSDFHTKIKNVSIKNKIELQSGLYQSNLQQIIDGLPTALSNRYSDSSKTKPVLTVTDETSNFLNAPDYTTNYYTRVYLFKLDYYGKLHSNTPELKKSISRRIYLSPTPSFLQYAVGAKDSLILNGASNIMGNIYGGDVSIRNQANYVDASNDSESKAETPYPTITGSLIVQHQLQLWNRNSPEHIYRSDEIPLINQTRFTNYFYQLPPIIKKPDEEFVNMDFEQTLFDKLNVALSPIKVDPNLPLDPTLGDTVVNSIFKTNNIEPKQENISLFNSNPNFKQYIIDKNMNPGDIANDFPSSKKVIVMTDLSDQKIQGQNSSPFIIKDNIHLQKDQWLIVNGDLEIYNDYHSSKAPLDIQGNIIVLGNVTIHGFNDDTNTEHDEIKFDTTMYVTGDSSIYSTNITGLNDKQLVLLSKGNLLVNRTNEFTTLTDNVIPLKAFLYTDKSATLYGVGSAISINGGIFANESLTINAIRQNTVQTSTPNILIIQPEDFQNTQSSRFTVTYDKSILLSQLDGLPTVDSLRMIVDHYTFSK